MASSHGHRARDTKGARTGEQAPSGPGHCTHTHEPRATEGQGAANHTPRLERTGATQPTRRASGRSSTPRPLQGPAAHPKDALSDVGERSTPDAPRPGIKGNRRPPRVPPCRPHSVQGQLARALAVGLLTGPHAQPPRTVSQWVAGPSCTPQGWAVGHGRAPNPSRPSPKHKAPPPGALVPPPQRAKPARKSACCGVADESPRLHPPAP